MCHPVVLFSRFKQNVQQCRNEMASTSEAPSVTDRQYNTTDNDSGGLNRVVVDPEHRDSVARWQNVIPSFPWIAPGWWAGGRNPRKGRDQILPSGNTVPVLRVDDHSVQSSIAAVVVGRVVLAIGD